MAKIKLDIKKTLIKSAALGAGATAAVYVDKLPFVGTLDPKILAGVKVGVGALLPMFMKNDMVTSFADGMLAVGMNQLVSSFLPGQVAGIGAATDFVQLIKGTGDTITLGDGMVKGVGLQQGY
jgi:hypothetical protein